MTKKKKISQAKIEEIAAKNGCTQKQKALVAEIIENPNRNGKQIAMSAGYAEKMATDKALFLIRNEKVQNTLQELLKNESYDNALLAAYDEYMSLPITGKEGALKLEAMKQLHKIRGDYAPTKTQSVSVKFKPPTR